ncbi:unnamed protein product [Danaus chrysippus]|uniref:(African queen) hypothetical protein n=1 Tax=Danaus chrysippus TaxID=151541 RepID=A0A8J2W9L0_9NEOP|nr:unnamed protein product [Danaus chrysippus]
MEGISKQRNKWSLPSASPPSTKGCDCEEPAGLAARGGREGVAGGRGAGGERATRGGHLSGPLVARATRTSGLLTNCDSDLKCPCYKESRMQISECLDGSAVISKVAEHSPIVFYIRDIRDKLLSPQCPSQNWELAGTLPCHIKSNANWIEQHRSERLSVITPRSNSTAKIERPNRVNEPKPHLRPGLFSVSVSGAFGCEKWLRSAISAGDRLEEGVPPTPLVCDRDRTRC